MSKPVKQNFSGNTGAFAAKRGRRGFDCEGFQS